MEGPYRDLGNGFARLVGVEGARRGPSRIGCVEDALLELLRNARDAAASCIYVASTLSRRRYRTLTVLDDGRGIPDAYVELIFEPGVTSRHLNPIPDSLSSLPHGAGLSLYHIKNLALSAEVLSPSSPTSIRVSFDTRTIPERALQSASRPSKTNLLATARTFAATVTPPRELSLFFGPPAPILAMLLQHRIIQPVTGAPQLRERAERLGLGLSLRTIQRVLSGEIGPVGAVVGDKVGVEEKRRRERRSGPVLALGEEREQIEAILRRAAAAAYLELDEVRVEARPGEISLRARVYEPEEEYE